MEYVCAAKSPITNHQSPSLNRAFTLIELSVVFIIIGLIFGGILVGQDLIRAAEIRSIAAQEVEFLASVNTFYIKYHSVPGDMVDAQTIWGAATDCSTAQTTEATCNGNGNEMIQALSPSGTTGNERFLFWKHLYNAGMIRGSSHGVYSGVSTSIYNATSYNTPSGKITGSLWFAAYWGFISGNSTIYQTQYGNVFGVGGEDPNTDPDIGILTAKEAFALDTKIDDGKPGTGKVMTRLQPGSTCTVKADGVTAATYADTNTALYNVTNSSGKQCSFIFPNAF